MPRSFCLPWGQAMSRRANNDEYTSFERDLPGNSGCDFDGRLDRHGPRAISLRSEPALHPRRQYDRKDRDRGGGGDYYLFDCQIRGERASAAGGRGAGAAVVCADVGQTQSGHESEESPLYRGGHGAWAEDVTESKENGDDLRHANAEGGEQYRV